MRAPPPAMPRRPAGSPIAPGAEAAWTRADPADRRPALEQPRHAPPRLSFGMAMKRFICPPTPTPSTPHPPPNALTTPPPPPPPVFHLRHRKKKTPPPPPPPPGPPPPPPPPNGPSCRSRRRRHP